MIRITHLLDDFSMGSATCSLAHFDDPRIADRAQSQAIAIGDVPWEACDLDADLIVVHPSPCWSRLNFLASLRAENPDARIVQVEHTYTRDFERDWGEADPQFRSMLRTAARLVDEVIAISPSQHDWLCEVGIPAAKLHTISPWCSRAELSLVHPLQEHAGPLNLLCFARSTPELNIAALILAARRFDADMVSLTVLDAGPEHERLTNLARRCSNIRLVGQTPDPVPWLEASDAVVIPSLHETFGLAATDARIAGRPVLVADAEGLAEQASGGAGLALPMRDPDQIEAAIRELIHCDLAEMGAAARRSVIQQDDEAVAGWCSVIRRAGDFLWNEFGKTPVTIASA